MPFSAHDVHVRSLRVLFLHPLTSLQTWSTLFGDFKQLDYLPMKNGFFVTILEFTSLLAGAWVLSSAPFQPYGRLLFGGIDSVGTQTAAVDL